MKEKNAARTNFQFVFTKRMETLISSSIKNITGTERHKNSR
jgi:hypothetical protein